MALSYKARKRLALLVLLVGMPAYVVLAVSVLNLLPRLPFWGELVAYVFWGVAWIIPLKPVFKGIGQPESDL